MGSGAYIIIKNPLKSAEMDKNHFWGLLRREKSDDKISFTTIRNPKEVVISELNDISETAP